MLRPEDYYDSGTIYEEEITLSSIVNELIDKPYTKKEKRKILYTLIDEILEIVES